MSTHGEQNLPFINSINLVFSSLEMQRRLMQAKSYYKLFLFCLELNVDVFGITCFGQCFLFDVIFERH